MTALNCPVVVVSSEGNRSSLEIINNIRKIPADADTVDLGNGLTGYKHHNVTKYYENDILFLSQNKEPLTALPGDLLERIEGCVVYFDANDRDFLRSLKTYADFMEENNVEFGILLCGELFDNSTDGITYKEAKEYSNVLDVIELDRRRDGDDDDEQEQDDNINHHDPVGYDELLQALRAVVWSNVDLTRSTTGSVLRSAMAAAAVNGGANAYQPVPVAENGVAQPSGSNTNERPSEQAADASIEADLAKFEQLLSEVMMFKDTTANWSRNERLAYAERFAYAFDDLLGGGADGDSDTEAPDDNQVV